MRDDNYIFLWDAITNDWNIGDTARVTNLPTKLNRNPKHMLSPIPETMVDQ
ncbi:hypothetical protein NPIL_535231, partial [Nephila pilipes]